MGNGADPLVGLNVSHGGPVHRHIGGVHPVHGGHLSVYSWVGVHRALDPAFADDVPYTVAAVDLDEGARVIVRIDTPTDADATTFGARVRASYVDHADWTELRFMVEEPAS